MTTNGNYVPTYGDGIESAIKIVEASMGDASSGEDVREVCDARLAVVKCLLQEELAHFRRASGTAL